MALPPRLVWQVHDLAAVVACGRTLAKQREARQLAFTECWQDASGAGLLIASGSMHYFDAALPQMINELAVKPKYLLINRTPLAESRSVAVVQDGPGYRVACVLYNRAEIIRDFEKIGYEVRDVWQSAELSLTVPGYPEHDVPAYAGLFLRARDLT